MFAPNFVEYALRTAIGLARRADVLALVDDLSYRREVSPALELAHPAVRIVPVDFGVRGDRRFDLAGLIAEVAAFEPDVIHHQEQLPQVSTALIMRFRARTLQVLMVHDPLPHSSSFYTLQPHTWEFILRLRSIADLIVVHGPDNEAQLRRASPELAVPVVHTQHGVVLAPTDGMVRAPLPGRLLMFGWLQQHKGVDVFVQACAMLSGASIPYSAVIAGSGPEPRRLATAISVLPAVEVREGFHAPEAAIALMQEASLIVLPYRDATQSGVLATAFANGRPVVASRTGDMPRLVVDGENGLLVPPGEPAALAGAISRALTERGLLARMTDGAARTRQSEMNWDEIADGLVADYLQVLRRKGLPFALPL